MSGAENVAKPAAAPTPAACKSVDPTPHAPVYPTTAEGRRLPVEYVTPGFDDRYYSSRYYPSSHAVLDEVYPGRRIIAGDLPIRYAGSRYATDYAPRYYGAPLSASVIRSRRLLCDDYRPSVSVTRVVPGLTHPDRILAPELPRYYGGRYIDSYAPRLIADDYRYPIAPAVLPATTVVEPALDVAPIVAPTRVFDGRYYDLPGRYFDRYADRYDRIIDRPYADRIIDRPYADRIIDRPYADRIIDRSYADRIIDRPYADRLYSGYPYESRILDDSAISRRYHGGRIVERVPYTGRSYIHPEFADYPGYYDGPYGRRVLETAAPTQEGAKPAAQAPPPPPPPPQQQPSTASQQPAPQFSTYRNAPASGTGSAPQFSRPANPVSTV